MSPARLMFQNWIVALGRDPSIRYPQEPLLPAVGGEGMDEIDEIEETVEKALETLTEQEKFFIIRFYYMGQGYAEMSRLSGRARHRLTSIHRQALRKLRIRLSELVKRHYGIEIDTEKKCVICSSPFRAEIDTLIAGRDRTRTWRSVIETLNHRYSLNIKSPQTLIGHEKYH